MTSRSKGAAGEREFAGLISDYLGIEVKRKLGAARDGGDDIELGPYSIEVKRQERLSVPAWWRQCTSNAGEQEPLLAMRWSRGEWLVTMRAEHFFQISREEIVECLKTKVTVK